MEPGYSLVAYELQENALKEQEIEKAQLEDVGLIIKMEGNLYGGPELIRN